MPDLKFSDAPRIICKEMFALCVQNTNVLIGRNNDSHVNFFFDEPFSLNKNNFRHWKLLRSCVHELHGRCGSSPCVVDIINASKTYNFVSSTATTHTHTHTGSNPFFKKTKFFKNFFKKLFDIFSKIFEFQKFRFLTTAPSAAVAARKKFFKTFLKNFWRRRQAQPSPRGKNSSKTFYFYFRILKTFWYFYFRISVGWIYLKLHLKF